MPGRASLHKTRRCPGGPSGLVLVPASSRELGRGNSTLRDSRQLVGPSGVQRGPCGSSPGPCAPGARVERLGGAGGGGQTVVLCWHHGETTTEQPRSTVLLVPTPQDRATGRGRWGWASGWLWGRGARGGPPRLAQEGPGAVPCPLVAQFPAASPGWAQGLICAHTGPPARAETGSTRLVWDVFVTEETGSLGWLSFF